MRRTFLSGVLLLIAVAWAVPAFAAAEDSDLAGVYLCSGVNPDGSPYQSIVQVSKHENTFDVRWIDDAKVVAVGIGIRSGDVFSVAYYSGLPGLVVYKIESASRLVGQWTLAGADGAIFSETLTRTSGQAAPPGQAPRTRPQPQPQPEEPRRERRRQQSRPTGGSTEI